MIKRTFFIINKIWRLFLQENTPIYGKFSNVLWASKRFTINLLSYVNNTQTISATSVCSEMSVQHYLLLRHYIVAKSPLEMDTVFLLTSAGSQICAASLGIDIEIRASPLISAAPLNAALMSIVTIF